MGPGYILDTNTIIYYLGGVLPEYGEGLVGEAIYAGARISIITKIELLAWNPPASADTKPLRNLIDSATIYNLTDNVGNVTIQIRKEHRKIKLPDAIIAATCVYHNIPLITRNVSDFSLIKALKIINPFEPS